MNARVKTKRGNLHAENAQPDSPIGALILALDGSAGRILQTQMGGASHTALFASGLMLRTSVMNEHFSTLARWLANRLDHFSAFLKRTSQPSAVQSKFVDLAPTDQADEAGVYAEALLFATSNAKVFNIALTGPYGSGKSSIIQSFLKKYRRRTFLKKFRRLPLHISLAAFVPEAGKLEEKLRRQEIERSILQQMLYGADANKLPLSRFKRIQSPGFLSILKSFFIVIGLLAVAHLFLKRDALINGAFLTPLALSNWFNVASLVVAVLFLWAALHHFYVASFGVSLKSISLKDIEIRPASDNLDSILNRHLDEIIYFFQSTDYDLVIIEDLDRFEDAEIFVTLREINSLVNENAGVKRTIRFLYALRDDIFINTDRTKFFEFIVPVIPIINTSNSIDMVLKQGKRLALDDRLEPQFLREVSRYLNDLRLIQNIFNEYAVYVGNLETDNKNVLDANKLLAILIYKNVYPRDFEQLHRREGNLADILNLKDDLIAHGEASCRSEIGEIERQLEIAERQTPANVNELRQIYAMALIAKLPTHTVSVGANGQQMISLQQLASDDRFDQLIEERHINWRHMHGGQQGQDISSLQGEVDRHKTYAQRKAEIESKAEGAKSESLRRVRELRSQISSLRTMKFNELVRLNASRIEDLFAGFGEKGELARFLILEGYLDDTYYQYTSLFHSGRLSPNDNKFLIQIRAFVTPEPGFPIDNPQEVVAAMRDEDFRQSYVLNVKLVDCLLGDPLRYADKLRKLFAFLSSGLDSCEAFFEAYYAGGRDVTALLSGLARAWRSFVPTAIVSPNSILHVAQMLAHLPEKELRALAEEFTQLPEFISANLPEILATAPDLEAERLEGLGFEVKDLSAISEHPGVVRFMFEKGLFELAIENLEYIHHAMLGENDVEPLRLRNYTTLRSANDAVVMARVERDFGLYFQNILLHLESNVDEAASVILDIVRRDNLEQDDLEEFLGRQTNHLPTLEGVPERLQATLFKLRLIEPSWANCLAFVSSEGFEADSLVAYLDRDDIREKLLQSPLPSDRDALPLRRFLFDAATLSDGAYRHYVRALPSATKAFPENLEPAKRRILIEEGKVLFEKDSVDALADDAELQVSFVAANIEAYLVDPTKFALDDDFREDLLLRGIEDDDKRALIDLMDLNALTGLPDRAGLVGAILDRTAADVSTLGGSIAHALITHSRPLTTQISLFNKCHAALSDDDVRGILADLPRPYSEIKSGNYSARLANTAENLALVEWLDARNIISSWSKAGWLSDDIRVNLYRR